MTCLTDSEILSKFKAADTNNDGLISLEELEKCFFILRLPISKADIHEYSKGKGSILINSEQFLRIFRSRERLICQCYHDLKTNSVPFFDTDWHHHSLIYLRKSLHSFGFAVTDEDTYKFMQYYNKHNLGILDYADLISYLSSLPMSNACTIFDELLFHFSPSSSSSSTLLLSTSYNISNRAKVSNTSAIYHSFLPQTDFERLPRKSHAGTVLDIDQIILPEKTPRFSINLSFMTSNATLQLVSGAVAGVVSRSGTAPMDRLKVLMQAGGEKAPTGVISGLKSIYAQAGVKGFYQGNGINCFKTAPETATKMYMFELSKSFVAADPTNIKFDERFLAGCIAGAFSQTLIYPLEIVKTRMTVAAPNMYRSAVHCMRKIIKHEGIMSMFKGLKLSVIGVMPYSGLDLMTNSLLKDFAHEHYQKQNQEIGVGTLLLCGMVSSTVAMTATYPIGLMRTKLQTSGMPGSAQYSSLSQVVSEIIRTQGYRGFFRVSLLLFLMSFLINIVFCMLMHVCVLKFMVVLMFLSVDCVYAYITMHVYYYAC